ANWERAVREATERFSDIRHELLSALHSENPEHRSAAVATLTEAKDIESRELVRKLVDDPDAYVREEALEYLADYAVLDDVPLLFRALVEGPHFFLASCALQRLCADDGDIIQDDDTPVVREEAIARWREKLIGMKLLPLSERRL
ncbi:MAG TPA: hypothetical protein DCZ07_07815, partial [Alphaproteobacteria bacterium]|nr:hypothetical protein [Alphaproteobacteria bacterium]